MKTIIHWFRRDLRLIDNTALLAAASDGAFVIPVYVLSTWKNKHGWTGPPRQQFLCSCLASLAADLEKMGSKLIIRRGPAQEALRQLAAETNAEAIYYNCDPDPFGREVEESLAALPCETRGFKDIGLHERGELLNGMGKPYRVFTPYSRAWLKLQKPATANQVQPLQTPATISSEPLPTPATWGLHSDSASIPAGEAAAAKRADTFFSSALFRYAEGRNLPNVAGTSQLSIDLRYGTISPRVLFVRAEPFTRAGSPEERKSAQTFLNELAWRDFYFQVLWHWPEVLDAEFNPNYRSLRWRKSPEDFQRWCAGETGFPIVDAGMRQLNATGWMHNRLRMITAMFLCKDLQIDWREGERYFMQRLIDGDIAANNGGWQWCAGTGADAAPYFRIQNPWSQTQRYDPEAEYIKKWVPELRDVPARKLMQAPAPATKLVPNYPAPMVDHAMARELCLEMFRRP